MAKLVARRGPLNLLAMYLGVDLGLVGIAESWASDTLREAGLDIEGIDVELEDVIVAALQGLGVINPQPPARSQSWGGDPVLLGRGEFQRECLDLSVSGAGIDFEFHRVYGSSVSFLGTLGPAWIHSAHHRILESSPTIVTRVPGSLAEQVFVRHPRYGQAGYDYFVPPNGVHEAIVADGESFAVHGVHGVVHSYERIGPRQHRIRCIRDRYGNRLDFKYTDEDLLARVLVNSCHRFVNFFHDDLRRLVAIEDHTGRAVKYDYDEWGYLSAISGPIDPFRRREAYEYASIGEDRRLLRVIDASNRVIVENEYETSSNEWYGRVTRQAVNAGETHFVYENIASDDSQSEADLPVLRVLEYRRNGNQVEHLLNRSGNTVLRSESYVQDGRVRQSVTRSRYNADGEAVASVDPTGVVTQSLFGREQHVGEEGLSGTAHELSDVKLAERLGFGNTISSIRRGRRRPASDSRILTPPDVRRRDHPRDEVRKFRYDSETNLLVSESDPRHTESPDPLNVESAQPGTPNHDPTDPAYVDHQKHLTRYIFGPDPSCALLEVRRPTLTQPGREQASNALPSHIVERFISYDSKGRLELRVDSRGYEWFTEYYPEGCGSHEGFVRRQLAPHIDWILNRDRPDLAEVAEYGNWSPKERFILSSGCEAELVVTVEGVRISLEQSTDAGETVTSNRTVEVHVDGDRRPQWNQEVDPRYVVSDLEPGKHTVRIRSPSGEEIALGRVSSHVSEEFQCDELGRVICHTDERGNSTTVDLDELGRPRVVRAGRGPRHSVRSYEYDLEGNQIKEQSEWREADGRLRPERAVVRVQAFGPFGLLSRRTEGPLLDGDPRVTRVWYNADDSVRLSQDARGTVTRFQYDPMGRPVVVTRASCSPDASSERRRYDAAGRVLGQEGPRGEWHSVEYSDASGTLRSGLDTSGRATVETDPVGNLTVRDFDLSGNETAKRLFQLCSDGRYKLLARTVKEFNEANDLVREEEAVFSKPISTVSPIDNPDSEFLAVQKTGAAKASVREWHRDSAGNAVLLKHPTGGVDSRRFDGRGRLIDSTDQNGRRVFRIFDGRGNLVRRYLFDRATPRLGPNRPPSEVFVEDWEFDEFDRECVRRDAAGNVWNTQYDSLGNLTQLTNPLGHLVRFRYNAFGEIVLSEEWRSSGHGDNEQLIATRREYDQAGNLVTLIDAAGIRTSTHYDALNRPTSVQRDAPSGPVERISYDPSGNIRHVIKPNGLRQIFYYDMMNRNTRIEYDSGGIAHGEKPHALAPTFHQYDYDATGRLVMHENDNIHVDLERDSRGLVNREYVCFRVAGGPVCVQVLRGFDLERRLCWLRLPSGRLIEYGRYPGGLLKSIRRSGPNRDVTVHPCQDAASQPVAAFGWIGSRLNWTELGNGSRIDFFYDGRGYELERRLTAPNGHLQWRHQRLRDGVGNARVETVNDLRGERTHLHFYDSKSQLIGTAEAALAWVNPVSFAPPTTPLPDVNTQYFLDAAIRSARALRTIGGLRVRHAGQPALCVRIRVWRLSLHCQLPQ